MKGVRPYSVDHLPVVSSAAAGEANVVLASLHGACFEGVPRDGRGAVVLEAARLDERFRAGCVLRVCIEELGVSLACRGVPRLSGQSSAEAREALGCGVRALRAAFVEAACGVWLDGLEAALGASLRVEDAVCCGEVQPEDVLPSLLSAVAGKVAAGSCVFPLSFRLGAMREEARLYVDSGDEACLAQYAALLERSAPRVLSGLRLPLRAEWGGVCLALEELSALEEGDMVIYGEAVPERVTLRAESGLTLSCRIEEGGLRVDGLEVFEPLGGDGSEVSDARPLRLAVAVVTPCVFMTESSLAGACVGGVICCPSLLRRFGAVLMVAGSVVAYGARCCLEDGRAAFMVGGTVAEGGAVAEGGEDV